MGKCMKLIKEITDKDILGIDGLSETEPRYTARAILKNTSNQYAVMYAEKFDLYSFPGGGIEGSEDKVDALKREVLEETGCICKSIEELGCVYENRAHCNYTQYSYYYVVTTEKTNKKLSLTDEERKNKTRVLWCSLDEAVQLIFHQTPKSNQQEFLKARDVAALKKYLEILNEND